MEDCVSNRLSGSPISAPGLLRGDADMRQNAIVPFREWLVNLSCMKEINVLACFMLGPKIMSDKVFTMSDKVVT